MPKTNQQNWFYITSIIFAIALPFSVALISVAEALLLLTALIHFNSKQLIINFPDRRTLICVIGVFFIYIGWLIFTNDWKCAIYDLRKNMAYFVIPLAFILSPKLSSLQYKRILYVFSVSVVLSSIITLVKFYLEDDYSILDAQKYGFMHHIRFSLQLIFSMVILWKGLTDYGKKNNTYLNITLVAALLILAVFLVWHQSLTGIITLLVTVFAMVLISIINQPKRKLKIATSLILFAIIAFPIAYLYYAIDRFYNVDPLEISKLEKFTAEGNVYEHDVNKQITENGHYVWIYVCDKELEEEWNKRAELKYNESDNHGYVVKYTLIRYLTSKNLRKDAEGVKALSDDDIKSIENGISNYILADKSISLYPRIYVSIWELDTYFKTGNANHRSLAQRIEYTKAAISIIKNNFWLGVGTGNWRMAYVEEYKKANSKMDPARYGNVHNQYLNYMVKFGIIGFILIFAAILYPVIKTKTYRNQLFLLFLVIMFIGNLGDANFETHTGSNFFMFFYCLFLVPKLD